MAERRRRKRRFSVDHDELIARSEHFYTDDISSRSIEMNQREQRYAKFRQWRGVNPHQPWPDASDAAMPNMMTASLRMQDTLFNAAMATSPIIVSKATHKKDAEKQDAIDQILHYQALVENKQQWLGDLIDTFVNDGHFTAYIPWVEEEREVSELRISPPIPEDVEPGLYFLELIANTFPDLEIEPSRDQSPAAAWDWIAEDELGRQVQIAFYTDHRDNVEMVVTHMATVFNGPKINILDRSDVLHPVECDNLHVPGPSNPGGASHVMLVSRPTIGEIQELVRTGFYDAVDDTTEIDELVGTTEDDETGRHRDQRQIIGGQENHPTDDPQEHERVTRLVVFDRLDIDGDGILEDVVYWMLREPKEIILRVRRLSEVFPTRRALRPFAEASFVPVKGMRTGIGLLEMDEGMHDLKKQLIDQMMDTGTFALSPFFFYRPTSSMKPEVIRVWPGEGYPLSDPKNDVNFPNINTNGLATGFNMFTLLDRDEERLTMLGDFQFGRVPAGKSSALRTVGGMSLIASQGEARPERILRRFFEGLSQIWMIMHELNRHFLPKEKQIRIITSIEPGMEAYRTVKPNDIDTTVDFEFSANVFNTSKAALQEALAQLTTFYINELTVQLGISQPDGIYRLLRDLGKAWGQDPDKYISNPVGGPVVSFEDVITAIMDNRLPVGLPMEGAQQQLDMIAQFANADEFGFLTAEQVQLFETWIQILERFIEQEAALAAQAQAAGNFGGGVGTAGGTTVPPDNSQAPLQTNELADETLPSAGGGGNVGQ